MDKFISKTPVGVIILDGKDKVIGHKKFPKDAKLVAAKLAESECREEKALKAKHPGARPYQGRPDLKNIAIVIRFCRPAELQPWLLEVNKELAKLRVGKELAEKDKLLVQAVRAQKMVEEATNRFSELLHEWYSIHFPELTGLLQENEDYARFVQAIGDKKEATKKNEKKLKSVLKEERFSRGILKIAPESIGADLAAEDLAVIQSWASRILGLSEENEELKGYIESLMNEIAPNVAIVASPAIGAKLIEEAGSLRELAIMPASTIQVLGAQRAMFRFLKTKKRPPKYGVLFSHPLVASASKTNKGRIARSVASKISIAARVDFAGGKPIGNRLLKELEARASSLKV